MPEVFSHSRLSSFETCPRQFYFRYVLQLPQETEGIEAFVGKRVHEILERLYEFVRRSLLPALPRVLERYHAAFTEGYDPERVRIVRTGTPLQAYRALGERCIETYYRRHYPFDADETLGIEEKVEFDLDAEGRYRMRGIVDRSVRARDGAVEVHDYKTGRWMPSQKRLDEDRQLALYQMALRGRYGADQPIRLVWHYLARGVTRTSQRTPEQLETLRTTTRALIDRVRDERHYAPRKQALCDWCEFRSVCPAFSTAAPPVEGPHRPAPASVPQQLQLL